MPSRANSTSVVRARVYWRRWPSQAFLVRRRIWSEAPRAWRMRPVVDVLDGVVGPVVAAPALDALAGSPGRRNTAGRILHRLACWRPAAGVPSRPMPGVASVCRSGSRRRGKWGRSRSGAGRRQGRGHDRSWFRSPRWDLPASGQQVSRNGEHSRVEATVQGTGGASGGRLRIRQAAQEGGGRRRA